MVKLKKYKKFGEIVNFKYLNKYEVDKYVFISDYLEIFGNNLKENIDKNDNKFFFLLFVYILFGRFNLLVYV